MIRPANLSDLDALVQLEARCFASDRLSRRSFHYLLTRGNAILLVDEEHGRLRGYVLVRFHARSPRARLYSIAMDPQHHGKGAARALLTVAEETARARGAVSLHLELRRDNHAAMRLYQKMGYRLFDTYPDYYADHADALRMEKSLTPSAASNLTDRTTLRAHRTA